MKRLMQIALVCLFLPVSISAQQDIKTLKGKVVEESEEGTTFPLIGANVYWMGTTIGTVTDLDGLFELEQSPTDEFLVISYTGFKTDTLEVVEQSFLDIKLSSTIILDGVEVVHRRKSTEISLSSPMKVEVIREKELLKAACCNLSESFETSPSIDVSFTDAVTGTRQIQMLGLAGPYSQITRELMPDIRGLSSIYGFTFIPGPWIESIQLNKGAGSVANGYESITGQINVELKKPEEAERLYLNGYANEGGRYELNANFAHRPKNKDWSTALLLHAKTNQSKHDRNGDGFLDKPTGDQFMFVNRWKYVGETGINSQLGIRGTFINNVAGQMSFNPDLEETNPIVWGMKNKINRIDGWMKIGKVYFDAPWKTIGLQLNVSNHSQEALFGNTVYDASQTSLFGNLMYVSIISNIRHNIKTGFTFQYDNYNEVLGDTLFERSEIVNGVYGEYTFSGSDDFDLVIGARGDHHSDYGFFVTPRVHVRQCLGEKSVIRFSGGLGRRTASIIAENIGILSSSRDIVIMGEDNGLPYGLEQESAWNYGLNFTQKFTLDYRDGSISLDFYRTQFRNQIILDLDQSSTTALFYNLDGKSYSNSFQAQFDYELVKRLDLRLAYRWYDVKSTFSGELKKKPLLASHRAFLNLGYSTRSHWSFDYTLNWQSQKRIPFTGNSPEEFRQPEASPDFFLMNAQISKVFAEKFELYMGVENLLDYKQEDPIISSDEPYSDYFDSSLIWGPIFGRNVYVGFRYRLK